jgi:hypothetical protein
VADHVVRLRDRLRAARYGPRGAGDGAGIAAELERVLASLGHGEGRRRRTRHLATVAAALATALAAGGAAAQSLTAEPLYEAGALRAAADSFAARGPRRTSPRTGTASARRTGRPPTARPPRPGRRPRGARRGTRWCGMRASSSRPRTLPARTCSAPGH